MQYTIERSRRRKRSISMRLRDGQLVVQAPMHVGDREVARFVQSKGEWLQAQQRKSEIQQGMAPVIALPGRVLFEGRSLPVLPDPGMAGGRGVLEADSLAVGARDGHAYDQVSLAGVLTRVLKRHAKVWLPERTAHWANYTGLEPDVVSVRTYKARWGTCTSAREVKLNWRLVQAPVWVTDYVILHELCHLKHMNHSRRYWALVADYCDTVVEAKTWLKDYGDALIW